MEEEGSTGGETAGLNVWERLMPDTLILVILAALLVAAAIGSFRAGDTREWTAGGVREPGLQDEGDPIYEWDEDEWH